ncbi:MAG: nucleotide exchange factor GrpE [Syntrophobacteraceae bacterium CG2_30_61_12]|nr:MAG: nucleotide exchange factor GrpE [Syntrophobacteraceae bacterium CG2_30_61_12]
MTTIKVTTSNEQQGDEHHDEALEQESGPEQGSVFDPETATLEQWRAECDRKDEELSELQDKLLRFAAEMENTRKRLERERREGVSYANESLIRAVLPVLDNLQRALLHGTDEVDVKALVEGVQMTAKSFSEVLEKFGCKPFASLGQPFDPNFHEAMLHQESDQQPDNTVLQEFQQGYLLHDRLLRPAMVIVAKAASRPEPAPARQDNMDL